ncbi:hypothetical protein C8R47DRAFT_1275524 [Mycena vitilis]|nr:hypothetical protein C8R47DRAFT_1275524 [Mycena vitilis]
MLFVRLARYSLRGLDTVASIATITASFSRFSWYWEPIGYTKIRGFSSNFCTRHKPGWGSGYWMERLPNGDHRFLSAGPIPDAKSTPGPPHQIHLAAQCRRGGAHGAGGAVLAAAGDGIEGSAEGYLLLGTFSSYSKRIPQQEHPRSLGRGFSGAAVVMIGAKLARKKQLRSLDHRAASTWAQARSRETRRSQNTNILSCLTKFARLSWDQELVTLNTLRVAAVSIAWPRALLIFGAPTDMRKLNDWRGKRWWIGGRAVCEGGAEEAMPSSQSAIPGLSPDAAHAVGQAALHPGYGSPPPADTDGRRYLGGYSAGSGWHVARRGGGRGGEDAAADRTVGSACEEARCPSVCIHPTFPLPFASTPGVHARKVAEYAMRGRDPQRLSAIDALVYAGLVCAGMHSVGAERRESGGRGWDWEVSRCTLQRRRPNERTLSGAIGPPSSSTTRRWRTRRSGT